MAIDILGLKPTTISRDLKGKFICIYGLPKVGKTTLACQFPKNLLLGFEHGWNAIAGAMATDIVKWTDFKLALRQLESEEAHKKFNTITIDTIGIAWEMCEQFICSQNSVQKISDIPWGGGYSACKKEFENCLRKITQLGYGLVVIAHVDTHVQKGDKDDEEIITYGPAIPKRAYDIVNQLVDIIGYIDVTWDENGTAHRYLYTRKTPTIMAGSRFKYLEPKIPFGYDEIVEAINNAIDMSERLDGAKVVEHNEQVIDQRRSFEEVRAEAFELWKKLVGEGENAKPEMAAKISKKVEIIFGRKIKLSEITEDQVDLFELVVMEMKNL